MPWSLAYWFALDTTHAGVSEIPCHACRVSRVVGRTKSGKAAYQIEHFALCDKVMKGVHDLLNRGCPIPPVHIQDIDIRGTKLLEGCLDGEVEGLGVISGVVDLVSDLILAPLVVGCILSIT